MCKKNSTKCKKQNENVSEFSAKNAKEAKCREHSIKRDRFQSTKNDCYCMGMLVQRYQSALLFEKDLEIFRGLM